MVLNDTLKIMSGFRQGLGAKLQSSFKFGRVLKKQYALHAEV